MIWQEPIVVRLADRHGASGAAICQDGAEAGSTCNSGSVPEPKLCNAGSGATEGCIAGSMAQASGSLCNFGTGN